jgi:predicted site-specific integrase-resolvase
MTQEESINLRQMAARFKVQPRTVRQWVYDGKIRALKIKGLRFTESAIREFETQRTIDRKRNVT